MFLTMEPAIDQLPDDPQFLKEIIVWYMYALLIKLPELKSKEDLITYLPQKIDREIIETLRTKHQSR
jgi:uncharacterized protein Usg